MWWDTFNNITCHHPWAISVCFLFHNYYLAWPSLSVSVRLQTCIWGSIVMIVINALPLKKMHPYMYLFHHKKHHFSSKINHFLWKNRQTNKQTYFALLRCEMPHQNYFSSKKHSSKTEKHLKKLYPPRHRAYGILHLRGDNCMLLAHRP